MIDHKESNGVPPASSDAPTPERGYFERASVIAGSQLLGHAGRTPGNFVLVSALVPACDGAEVCDAIRERHGIGHVAVTKLVQAPRKKVNAASAYGEIQVNPGRHEVIANGKQVMLTRAEFRILAAMTHEPGWVFNRQRLAAIIHGGRHVRTGRAVDVHVAAIRRKLGRAGDRIQTIRGVGYRLAE